MIKSRIAAEKVRLILENSLIAYTKACFSKTSLEYSISGTERYEPDSSVLFKIYLKLSEGVEGITCVSVRHKSTQIRHLVDLEDYTGQKRIDSFAEICSEEKFDYYLHFDSSIFFEQIKTEIERLGGEKFEIAEAIGTDYRMDVSLRFTKGCTEVFQFNYYEKDRFLKTLENFSEVLKKKNVDSNSTLTYLIKNSPLNGYRVKATSLFNDKFQIEHIILPEGMKEIPSSLFFKCKNLKSVVIPESIEKIGQTAFLDCINLTKINFPQNLKEIGYMAFAYCKNLSIPPIPKNCKIEPKAFMSGCYDPYEDDYDNESEYDDYDIELEPKNWY